ncbi:hypothetical protein M8C21_019810, partial [Ambrosia artemisiifolia]
VEHLHSGIAEVAAAKARMFVNKPDGKRKTNMLSYFLLEMIILIWWKMVMSAPSNFITLKTCSAADWVDVLLNDENGFKTMRLGADVIVFSHNIIPTGNLDDGFYSGPMMLMHVQLSIAYGDVMVVVGAELHQQWSNDVLLLMDIKGVKTPLVVCAQGAIYIDLFPSTLFVLMGTNSML